MEWVIFEILGELQKSYEHEAVMKELERVIEHLELLEIKLDQEIMIRVRAGLANLNAYVSSDNPDVKTEELRMAREKFSELMALEPTLSTMGLPNEILICFGYWGSYLYFGLRGDKKNAALHVYECIQKWPLWGLTMFPSNILSKNYSELTTNLLAEMNSTTKQLEEIESNIHWKNVWGYAKTGIVAFAVLGIPGVVAGLTAKKIHEKLKDTTSPEEAEKRMLLEKLIELNSRYENTLKKLDEECGNRIRNIRKMQFK